MGKVRFGLLVVAEVRSKTDHPKFHFMYLIC